MSCICGMICSGGDSAPRLWVCEEHGKTGMCGTISIIEKISEKQLTSFEETWDTASLFLLEKRLEFSKKGQIYFDEDYFNEDLTNKFINKVQVAEEPKSVQKKNWFSVLLGK